MPFSLLKKRGPPQTNESSIPSTKSAATIKPTSTSCGLVFSIIELLELIFSFVDDNIIRTRVILVCHQWLIMNQHRLGRNLCLDEFILGNKLQAKLKNLAGVQKIWARFNHFSVAQREDLGHMFLEALRQQDEMYQKWKVQQHVQIKQPLMTKAKRIQRWIRKATRASSTQASVVMSASAMITKNMATTIETTLKPITRPQPMQELELRCMFVDCWEDLLKYHFPSTLVILKIRVITDFTFQISNVLEDCPLLEVLELHARNLRLVGESWVPASLQPFLVDYRAGTKPSKSTPKLLRLQSLRLSDPYFMQPQLEELLIVTPQLVDLVLKDVKSLSPESTNTIAEISTDETTMFSWSRLHQHLQQLPIHLRSFQTSHCCFYPNAIIDDRQKMIQSYPGLKEWSFSLEDISPTLLQELEMIPNVVTSLVLILPNVNFGPHTSCTIRPNVAMPESSEQGSVISSLCLLHQYLCESPHLQHLKAINCAIDLEDLDIWGRIEYGTLSSETLANMDQSVSTLSKRKPIWICRNLRTLEVEIHSHRHGVWPISSRIIFGYIAAVCPRLEVLHLQSGCSWSDKMGLGRCLEGYTRLHSLQLLGGLCLLSRLQGLKHLTVNGSSMNMPYNCWEFEINWITPSGQLSLHDKQRRKAELAQWKSCLIVERQLEERKRAIMSSTIVQDDTQNQDEQGVDHEMLHEVGLLSTVKRKIERIDSNNKEKCFPMLAEISLEGNWSFGHSPEMMLQIMFP